MARRNTWLPPPSTSSHSARGRTANGNVPSQISQSQEGDGSSAYGESQANVPFSDSEEEDDYDNVGLAEAMLASQMDYANLANNHPPGALGHTETSEDGDPSGSSQQPPEIAIPQNRPEGSGHTFGSNETVYNPYSPSTSYEYVEQEVAAGRLERKDINKRTEEASNTPSPSLTENGTIRGILETIQPSRALENARSTLSRAVTGQHNSLTHLSTHLLNNAAAQSYLPAARRVVSQDQQSGLAPPQSQRGQELSDELLSVIDPVGTHLTPSRMQARLRTLMMQEMDTSLGHDTAVLNPNISTVSQLRTLSAPVAAENVPPPNLSTQRIRRPTRASSSRRRDPMIAAMRNPADASAASSALAQASTPASSTSENLPVLARKRRRADTSPEEAPLPPPLSSTIRQNRSRRLIARPISTGTSASSLASRGRAALNAQGPTSAAQSPASQGGGIPPLLQSQLATLPIAIQRRIMEFVYNYNENGDFGSDLVVKKTRIFPDFESVFDSNVVFSSELLPRAFNAGERQSLLDIFRKKAPYVPAAITTAPNLPPVQWHVTNGSFLYKSCHGRGGQGWPEKHLPTEVFDNIVNNLARDDIRQMRLVNHEFEAKVSNKLFRRVVVPFRPEIYGLIVKKDKPVEVVDVKGKGKTKAKANELPIEEDTTGKDVHDGMKVFQAWGPHINQFAMAFEIDEGQLSRPPQKEQFEWFVTYWGKFKWPHPYYNRFEICAQLEKKADEYRCMSIALSNLKKVKDLGLSIDSGLGWLVGPDISDRAELFKDKPQVFGQPLIPNSKHEVHKRTWANVVNSLTDLHSYGTIPSQTMVAPGSRILTRNMYGFYEIHLYHPYARGFDTPTGWEKGYFDSMSSMRLRFAGMPGFVRTSLTSHPLVFGGTELSSTSHSSALATLATAAVNLRDLPSALNSNTSFSYARLKPNNLATAQKELLLETEWAQRAFLSSYCMSLTDNTEAFQHVRTLTIAKLSSRYLGSLQRDDFWRALPQLNELVFYVSPDFRDIQKTDTGVVEAVDLNPSEAAAAFRTLLLKCVVKNWSIKTMTLGYFGGGERQTGIFGRNKHILPAPLTDCGPRVSHGANAAAVGTNEIVKQDPEDILALPHVEHLTLTNCWIAPSTLKDFVTELRAPRMQTLTLDSVSLTAHSGFVMDTDEPDPMDQAGFFRLPEGPPRLFDPIVGNLHEQRGNAPHPYSVGQGCWNVNGGRIGSWRNVIDTITPGPTIDLLRWVYQHTADIPQARQVGDLQRINFKSCGYVRLNNLHNQGFDQSGLDETVNSPPAALQQRALGLMPIMMIREHDKLLGQIVPNIPAEEQEVFRSAFPMTLGWADRETATHVLEDGQPIGGTGRFSGRVEKLLYPDHGS